MMYERFQIFKPIITKLLGLATGEEYAMVKRFNAGMEHSPELHDLSEKGLFRLLTKLKKRLDDEEQ